MMTAVWGVHQVDAGAEQGGGGGVHDAALGEQDHPADGADGAADEQRQDDRQHPGGFPTAGGAGEAVGQGEAEQEA